MATKTESIPVVTSKDTLTTAQFDEMMKKGLSQAKSSQVLALDEAFERIERSI